ncbi:MAG: hypothetical protein DSO07_09400 [Thermoproteota archaeon]|uniref:Uncharacterized protein n=1 Tax=Candidatus Methanodesulfokora washburnensis TaxID=2478471 RepID=A0A520KHM7_9CREN|nr:MAG: hypothetical protein EF810_07310 [Candidatus Methanodesulfokores washburnensis]TDA40362.1 MAG: hypothetical protein DSO07_09400 [Candidatus Korarchaeota archaeon]
MIFSGRAGIYELSSDIKLRIEKADELRKARGKLSQSILGEISSKFIITVGDRVLSLLFQQVLYLMYAYLI